MKKEEVFKELEILDLPKDKYIVISGASLVCQDIIDETDDIDLTCSKEFYNKLDWPTRIGAFGKEVKYKDCFEISDNLYEYQESFRGTTYSNGYLNNWLLDWQRLFVVGFISN